MRYLVALPMLLGLGAAHSTAAAKNTCSNDMSFRADASLESAAGAWGSLLNHWRAYRSCDDGGVAEGYSDAVVVLLAHRWDQFDAFASLSKRNPAFRRWAIGHIDATTSNDDLKKVVHNAASCTGSATKKHLCVEIGRAARDALKD
jgi:hypothetical protein